MGVPAALQASSETAIIRAGHEKWKTMKDHVGKKTKKLLRLARLHSNHWLPFVNTV